MQRVFSLRMMKYLGVLSIVFFSSNSYANQYFFVSSFVNKETVITFYEKKDSKWSDGEFVSAIEGRVTRFSAQYNGGNVRLLWSEFDEIENDFVKSSCTVTFGSKCYSVMQHKDEANLPINKNILKVYNKKEYCSDYDFIVSKLTLGGQAFWMPLGKEVFIDDSNSMQGCSYE